MRILAYHLPAFHRIPENDAWWGEGFTEWDNARSGKPLFPGHVQPLSPHGGKYYDLSHLEDIAWQIELAKKYGVYGFVHYHYWFNGKLLLEKPCEMLLQAKYVDCRYCFCWANEQWARTWDGKNGDVLMPQTFGGQEDWENHLMYLLPFFQDERYIRRDGMPMLFVYSAARIPHFDEMLSYWNARLKDYGIPGIYLVEFINTVNPGASSSHSQAVTEFEPHYTCRFDVSNLTKAYRVVCKKLRLMEMLDYDRLWKLRLKRRRVYGGREIIQGVFCAWDNTPRKGKSGMVVNGATADKFEKYLRQLLHTPRQDVSKEYMVINAWNEWGEGAILEPSEQYGFAYLEAVKRIADELRAEGRLDS